jgi:hypothetical protein
VNPPSPRARAQAEAYRHKSRPDYPALLKLGKGLMAELKPPAGQDPATLNMHRSNDVARIFVLAAEAARHSRVGPRALLCPHLPSLVLSCASPRPDLVVLRLVQGYEYDGPSGEKKAKEFEGMAAMFKPDEPGDIQIQLPPFDDEQVRMMSAGAGSMHGLGR